MDLASRQATRKSGFEEVLRISAWPASAFAYRPFDGTDPAVAEPGEIEIELQPAGVLRESSQTTLIARHRDQLRLSPKIGKPSCRDRSKRRYRRGPSSLSAAGLLLKHVLRPGSLQNMSGPSVATEFGVLLPDTIGDWVLVQACAESSRNAGTGAPFISTQRPRSRASIMAMSSSEASWKVRRNGQCDGWWKCSTRKNWQSHTISGLVRAIWQVRDNLSFDVGVRHALTNVHSVNEVRVGMTFGFALRQLEAWIAIDPSNAR